MYRRLLLILLSAGALATACHGPTSAPNSHPQSRVTGQTNFVSAPPNSSGGGVLNAAGGAASGAAPQAANSGSSSSSTRTVQETDIYRVDGNRLYYLNSYRGLMVFDISDVDHPKLLGRSPIYGTPVQMIVTNGIASVVVADWFGVAPDGSPFHGSVVRQIDATDPTNMKILGEAELGGWVSDTRVVGHVLYAVSEDYGWVYGFEGGPINAGAGVASAGTAVAYPGYSQSKVIVSSVDLSNGVTAMGHQEFPGWGGVINVTPNSIILAYPEVSDLTQPYSAPTGNTIVQYIDISDPNGAIRLRGAYTVHGTVQGWGTDNGRWNLDFADQQYAHTIACGGMYCGGTNGTYVLSTVDFTNPDAPSLASELTIPATGWDPAARFDNNRLYLAPSDSYVPGVQDMTPIQIYDLSNPKAPKLSGETAITGSVWNFTPDGNNLFALGSLSPDGNSSAVSLSYLDVTDPAHPVSLGTASFGDGWAWTPAAGTFKAFTKDDTQGLVVLPFSGWNYNNDTYTNGLQLLQFNPTSITAAGAAHTKGWVQRGIFANGRLLSMSDLSLAVIDYSDQMNPKVVSELTLARNVVDANPGSSTIAELSDSDWWGNDLSTSEMRILPLSNADEQTDDALADLSIPGVNARVFRNGNLDYVVTDVRSQASCTNGQPGGAPTGPTGTGTPTCYAWTQQVNVVDLSNGGAVLRGSVALPIADGYYYYGWGWGGFYPWDWYNGADVVQVGSNALAFRRWLPNYTGNWDDASTALFVVDLSNADHPTLASTTITQDKNGWWGDMRAIGNTLYTTHYDWIDMPGPNGTTQSYVKYYLDSIDLTDLAHPKVGSSVNVPGVLVGASSTDPTMLYFIDYWWNGNNPANELSVAKLSGGAAYLQGAVKIDGWTGSVFVVGTTAYLSAQQYSYDVHSGGTASVSLHQIDLSDPSNPVDSPSMAKDGWGWLLGIEGDRAILTSGWGDSGVDIYKLTAGQAPTYDQFVRTNGWAAYSLTRQGNTLYLASGEWGVQVIPLQ